MLKRILPLAFAGMAGILLWGATADARTLDEIKKAGVIRIGVHPNLPPNSVMNTKNELEGMDVDLGNMIAKALEVKAEFVPQQSPERVPNLISDRIDICLGGLARTPARAQVIDYTLPTFTEAIVVLTTDKLANVKTWKELDKPEITLVNVRGTSPVEWARQNVKNSKELLLDSGADVIRAIAQGRADATVAVIDTWMAFTRNHPDVKWRVVPDVIHVDYQAIGVARGNDTLKNWLNLWLFNWQRAGGHVDIWEKWFGRKPDAPIVPNPYF